MTPKNKTTEGFRVILIHKKAPKRFFEVDKIMFEVILTDQMIFKMGCSELFMPVIYMPD